VVLGSLAGVAIGIVVAVQARINGEFAVRVGDAVGAAALGFVLTRIARAGSGDEA